MKASSLAQSQSRNIERWVPARARKTGLVCLCALAGAGMAASISGCSKPARNADVGKAAIEEAKKSGEEVKENFKGLVISGGELSGGDTQGRPLWKLSAKEIRASGGGLEKGTPRQAVLTGATAMLFREGEEDTAFTASTIEMFNTPQGIRLKMSGDVTATTRGRWVNTGGAVSLKAPRADVDVQKRLLSVSGGVTVRRGDVEVKARQLRAETSLKAMEVSGGVEGKSPQGTLGLTQAQWNWDKGTVTGTGPVLKKDDLIIRGESLQADTRLSAGQVLGAVKAEGPNGNAVARDVKFDWKANRIRANSATFTPRSQPGQPSATLTGTQIETDSQLKVSRARNATVNRDGGVLKAAVVTGFDKLGRLTGEGVSYSAADLSVTAARADWGNGRINGSGGIRLQKGQLNLTGQSFQGDDKLENAVLVGRARGTLATGETLFAPKVEKQGNWILASGGVTGSIPRSGALGDLKLKARSLKAAVSGDTMELKGGVEVDGSRGASLRAPSAEYNRKQNRITAAGPVKFVDKERGLEQTGDSLVVDLTTRQATLKNVRGSGNRQLFDGRLLD